MYIKYRDSIHNLDRFKTYNGGSGHSTIRLLYEHSNGIILSFESTEIRDFVQNRIWVELMAGNKCFDIDEAIDKYKLKLKKSATPLPETSSEKNNWD